MWVDSRAFYCYNSGIAKINQRSKIPKMNKINTEIPIFFTTDDNYVPYLDVAIRSLIANASRDYEYRIIVLNTGLDEANIRLVKESETAGFKIDFVDISAEVENIKSYFKNIYHFSVVTYYRLFIASLFPQYDKVLYLDCDLVVLGDVSELYFTDMGNNILAGSPDQHVSKTYEFREYVEKAIGTDPDGYVNAGVLLMNLKEYRKCRIEEQFVNLITSYDFDLVDPDQAYLNFLCRGKIHHLPNGWNKAPTPAPCEGKKNIVHYNLYKKPWQYDDVIDGEHFWTYAKTSPFYSLICERMAGFTDEERKAKDASAGDILIHAMKIVGLENNFRKKLSAI